MSITGEPQVINTLKSSWELLDSPVPLKSKCSRNSTEHKSISFPPISNTSTSLRSECPVHTDEIKSKSLLPLSNTFTSLRTECTQDSTEPLHDITTESKISQSKQNNLTNPAEIQAEISASELDNDGIKRVKTESQNCVNNTQNELEIKEETPRESKRSGGATYVSTQRRRHPEDIAETIATEFKQRVIKSQSFAKKEAIIKETAYFQCLHNQTVNEDTDDTDLHKVDHEESTLSKISDSHIELHTDGVSEETNSNLRRERSPNSREYSEISRLLSVGRHSSAAFQGNISQNISSASHNSEVSNMSQSYADGQRNVYNNRSVNNRGQYRHPPPEHMRQVETYSPSEQNSRRNRTVEDQHPRPISNDSNLSLDQPSDTRFNERQQDGNSMLAEREEQEDNISRGNTTVSDTGRSRPDGVDHTSAAPTGPDEPFTRQTMPLPNVPPPNFHPPPTIIQNGISQADLLELMSKGLGQFTTEMAVMVIDKLKPEYEEFAKQVGAEVKESTVTELKELREKLKDTETNVETLTLERDNLKVENSKERDQMKKEFEKDRLKRVKEFEEKKELIESLQKGNDQFKGLLKEKDKMLKKADIKAKSEEQKRIKAEEESEKKIKEMQKELDKTKGELLVQKSKKRLQITSAQSKKECLGKLNSQHGLHHRQFNGHKPIQYDEGDD